MMKDMVNKMKDKIKLILMSVTAVLLLIAALVASNYNYLFQNPNLKYSQEYIIGKENIKGEVDVNYFESKGKEFEIGANKYGYAVFKNPKKAFDKLKKDYKKGIRLIQKENNLRSLSQFNYKEYGRYGWQVTTGTKEEQEQARFVTSFMDIYENSFKNN